MMNQMKRRISILLCFLLVFTTIFVATPKETQAATKYSFNGIGNGGNITVYKGATNFYAGDLIYRRDADNYVANGYELTYFSELKNVTYKSSNTSVASVDKTTGKITTKKTGTAKITMKYKKQVFSFDLRVVDNVAAVCKEIAKQITYGDGMTPAYWNNLAATAKKEAKAFLKKTGAAVTINKSNRYAILSASNTYTYNSGTYSTNTYNNSNPQTWIYNTDSIRVKNVYDKVYGYVTSLTPFTSGAARDLFGIKSFSGKAKSDTITVTLKEKVTADKIFALNYIYSWDTDVKESDTYTFPVQIQRTSTRYKYYAIATVKKGSNKMTVRLKNTRLVKGETYRLILRTTATYNASGFINFNFTGDKETFKAK